MGLDSSVSYCENVIAADAASFLLFGMFSANYVTKYTKGQCCIANKGGVPQSESDKKLEMVA